MSDLPFVSVVIPAHNEERYIEQCLNALINQDYPKDRYEIIVVDNNSKDRTPEIARSIGVKVLFKEKGPVGAVRNYGVNEANGEIIAFIDSDCVAHSSWLADGVQLIESNKNHAFGGGYNLREKPYPIEKYWLLSNSQEGILPNHLLGGTIFVKKEDFIRAGLFDTDITSGEDSKLTNTLRETGTQVSFSKKLSVIHLGNPITIKAFFKRQVWHSENYLRDLNTTLRDVTFSIIVLFYIAGIVALVSLVNSWTVGFVFSTSLFLAIPALLSAKRILVAHYKPQRLRSIFAIYLLDFLYLLGRCTGLTKGLLKLKSNHPSK